MTAGPPGFTEQIGLAGRGILRLARLDPRWRELFDLSWRGFLLSFVGRLLGLPFYLFFAAVTDRALGHGGAVSWAMLWPEGAAFLVDMAVYPLLILLVAWLLGLRPGYRPFVVLINWISFYLNILLALAAAPAAAVEGGLDLFGLFWFVLAALALYLTWRAARDTLSREVAPVALVVVLWVATGAFADQLVAWLSGHP